MSKSEQQIKPIETVYNGYRFRSRLEARWAVFFYMAGIKYEYEPEGFEVNGHLYLPDFYFPKYDIFGEVKGKPFTNEEKEKMAWAIDYGGPCSNGVIFFGNIPSEKEFEDCDGIALPFAFNNEGIAEGFAGFFLDGECNVVIQTSKELMRRHRLTCAPDFPFEDAGIIFDCVINDSAEKAIIGLYLNKARQARFEHGEKPMQRRRKHEQ